MTRVAFPMLCCLLLALPLGALAQEPAAGAGAAAPAAATPPPAAAEQPASGAPPAAPAAPDAVTGATPPGTHQVVPQPSNTLLMDRPSDDGTALLIIFNLIGTETTRIGAGVLLDGTWYRCTLRPGLLATLPTKADLPGYFGWRPPNPEAKVLTIDRYTKTNAAGEPESVPFEKDHEYTVRLVVVEGEQFEGFELGTTRTKEQWFNLAGANSLILSVLFAVVIMSFIYAARRNPNLFIRRIQGLEAVDEAIGRATEMGKPVLHINGLDPLSTLSTIAAVNILGRIARRVANYESDLLVPCFDPVVMTVSQEVVKNAYLEAGRPDAYREDKIFFLTDQQFSYVASVCGIMMREKPAANFLLGYFYAEALMLAETGSSTGAIQIAGTDALAQLPFFVTTCDYTLIGEELYAASAYLSREPMLLGSLKGQDVGKAFVMLIIVLGTVFSTVGMLVAQPGAMTGFDWDWITHLLSPLM